MKLNAPMPARVVAALWAILTLAACTPVVVVEETEPGPRFCTREYDPVCARRDGERETFANSCLADEAGYRVVRRGECGRDRDDDEETFCTREYAPVCARRRGDVRSFPNACEARASDYRIISDGPC